MGQKVHPYGFRLGVNKPWRSRWFATRDLFECSRDCGGLGLCRLCSRLRLQFIADRGARV